MAKFFSADFVFPVSSPPVPDGCVMVDDRGEVLGVYSKNHPEITDKTINKLSGIIVPGFINTHCHLELSYLHNKIPRHTGLIPFIKSVIRSRASNAAEATEAMEQADAEMWQNGIVAVGDISNAITSKPVKQQSKIYYHTFIELIGFNPENAKEIFRKGLALQEEFEPLHASIVPHSPYSVCKELFRFIGHFCHQSGHVLSMHNQESEEENRFYRYKSGKFPDFYRDIGVNIDFFKPQARNSIQTVVPLFPEKQHILLVHNTYTSIKDIYFVRRFGRDITWCFCPNANLYIENRLPKVNMFRRSGYKITLGTDSLASNNELCILSELKTLHSAFPELEFPETIGWATLNGARFLNIDERFGSLEKGKKPGLNLITHTKGQNITPDSEVVKLV